MFSSVIVIRYFHCHRIIDVSSLGDVDAYLLRVCMMLSGIRLRALFDSASTDRHLSAASDQVAQYKSGDNGDSCLLAASKLRRGDLQPTC